MLEVTDRALDKLEELLQQSSAQPGQAVTLGTTGEGQLGFGLGQPGAGDVVWEREGEPVMVAPESLMEALDGFVLDYVTMADEEGFTLGRTGAGDDSLEDEAPVS